MDNRRKEAKLPVVTPSGQRVRFETVEYKSEGDHYWTEVTLGFGDLHVTGRSASIASQYEGTGVRRTIRATIDALEKIVGYELECELNDVDLVHIRGEDHIALVLSLTFKGNRIQVFGNCRAPEDFAEAAARATLDAVNQHIRSALEGEST